MHTVFSIFFAADTSAFGTDPKGLVAWAMEVAPVIVLGGIVIAWLAKRYETTVVAIRKLQDERRESEIANLKILESLGHSLDKLAGMLAANNQGLKDEAEKTRANIKAQIEALEKLILAHRTKTRHSEHSGDHES